MVYKLFLSRFDSAEKLEKNRGTEFALEMKYHSLFVSIEASSLREALEIFQREHFEQLVEGMDFPVYVAQLFDDGTVKVLA